MPNRPDPKTMAEVELLAGITLDLSWRWVLQAVLVSLLVSLLLWQAGRRREVASRGLAITVTLLLALLPLGLLWQPGWPVPLGALQSSAGALSPLALLILEPLPLALAGLWLAGALVGIVALGVRHGREWRVLAALPAFADESARQDLNRLIEAMDSTPKLALGPRCCASSIGTPLIVLPAGFSAWPVAARRAVLAHEVEHLRRCDDRWLLGFDVLVRLLWFCPWLFAARGGALRAFEAAADERAAQRLGDRAAYLEGLASAALRERTLPATGCALAATDSSLLGRLDRLLQGGRREACDERALSGVATGAAIAIVLATGYHAVEPAAAAWPNNARLVPKQSAVAVGGTVEHYALPVVASLGPRSISRREPLPIYPGAALRAGTSGAVTVEFQVAGDGSVIAPRVVASKPPGVFDDAAIEAVRQARFARSSGSSAERVVLRKSYRFSLEQSTPSQRSQPPGSLCGNDRMPCFESAPNAY